MVRRREIFRERPAPGTDRPGNPGRFFRQSSGWISISAAWSPISLRRCIPRARPFSRRSGSCFCRFPTGRPPLTANWPAGRLAREKGRETMSAQAVGGAVGHNPISLIIPCAPGDGRGRQSHGIRRRRRQKTGAAGAGARGYSQIFPAEKRNRPVEKQHPKVT